MATQLKDGSFTEIKPMDEAVEDFNALNREGLAKAFHVGTRAEIEKVKNEAALSQKVDDLAARLADMEAAQKQIIDKPTPAEIEQFGNN